MAGKYLLAQSPVLHVRSGTDASTIGSDIGAPSETSLTSEHFCIPAVLDVLVGVQVSTTWPGTTPQIQE